jgi:hypothetical protein
MRTERLTLAAALLVVIGLFPAGACAQTQGGPAPAFAPIGKVLRATGSVTLEHKNSVVVQAGLPSVASAQAKVDDLIYQDDVIATAADGSAGIGFIDGTSFEISSNARMELNEFVYKPKSGGNSTIINLTKGAFTFIAGEVAHTGSMKVETPVATMGIRGTAPRVQILDDGSVKFTTLVEENKKKPAARFGPTGQRNAQNSLLLDLALLEKADKNWSRRVKLCGNC